MALPSFLNTRVANVAISLSRSTIFQVACFESAQCNSDLPYLTLTLIQVVGRHVAESARPIYFGIELIIGTIHEYNELPTTPAILDSANCEIRSNNFGSFLLMVIRLSTTSDSFIS